MSNSVKLPEDGSVQSALKRLRGEGREDVETRYLVIGYVDKNLLTVVAEGQGGLAEARSHLPGDQCRYVLLRIPHKVELATTIKFAYIDWTPETLPPMRKALLSTHKGQVEDLMKPYHVSLQASDESELKEETILHRIGVTSGTLNLVTDRKADFNEKKGDSAKKANLVPASIRDERPVKLEDEAALNAAIKDVRQDASSTNWVLTTYTDANATTLKVVGTGTGGVDELAAQFNDEQVFYALFRVNETVDKSVTTKFGFVKLLSDKVPPMKRAQISTHMGFITKLFQPYHVEFLLDNRSDFSAQVVENKIRSVMGLKSNVRTAEETKALQSSGGHAHTPSRTGPSVPVAGPASNLTVADELRQAIASVRKDGLDVNWAVGRYSGKDKMDFVGSGSGGLDEMMSVVGDDTVDYGILRVVDVIDKSKTTKFVYIRWLPEAVPYMRKADISTKKGVIDDLFRPFHVDFNISTKAEITSELVHDKVASASGSKSHVVG